MLEEAHHPAATVTSKRPATKANSPRRLRLAPATLDGADVVPVSTAALCMREVERPNRMMECRSSGGPVRLLHV